ncbi:helix-turn-helix transcriptional regulator [Nocardia terpenica]|uniref:HTH-type transcriptional regulator RipA n=1 Tax=Nocardia terpenica TaxID=455432 RepID=A0A161Z2E5_9NOCA|nr:helix-turn-helix transcriptional regulator [Nocardia terpenica]KZM72504.1 AraC family transcriptional regulator [Nocardia terpenica]MBF6059501.1 helix-turn-helix transcriptional regulator [Nocardia terpenica]MBF6102960.1 helix-turn-helix transcriptional regulator [Nocardia terpenica]MBF6110851.1 helix-turn-helix transcriptional regulator [Nocardia terpenica]MBF6116982.1 helix-turn-helix transcriptional regulator [Nocardia terpenica]
MRNVPISEVEGIDRPVLSIRMDYPPGHLLPAHRHRRAQFLYGATGLMRVETVHGSWTVPPRRAVLIPPGVEHRVLMDEVSTCSLYLEPSAVPWYPDRCRVVAVSPLLRELLIAAVDLPPEYDRHGRDGALVDLILYEIRTLTPLPFDLPLPAHPGLRRRCEEFQSAPTIRSLPAAWAADLGIAPRTFTRLFQRQTGLTFQQWRRRACLLHAVRLLSAGRGVTQVAAALGYDTPAAFTAMFRTQLGRTPSSFIAN